MMNKPQTLNFKGYEIAFKLSNYCDNGVTEEVLESYKKEGED